MDECECGDDTNAVFSLHNIHCHFYCDVVAVKKIDALTQLKLKLLCN